MGALSLLYFILHYNRKEAEAQSNSPLIADKPHFDLGLANQNQRMHHDFVLQNVGTHPLKIIKMEKSCGCTTLSLDKTILSPGEKCTLLADVDVETRRQDFESDIYLTSRTSESEVENTVKLSLVTHVYNKIALSSESIDLGELDDDSGKDSVVQIKIWRTSGPQLQTWDSIRISNPPKVGSCQILRHDDSFFELTYNLNPRNLPLGVIKDRILIQCTNKEADVQEPYEIPITAVIRSTTLQMNPGSFYFGVFSPNSMGTKKIVTLRSLSGEFGQITTQSDRPDLVATEVEKQNDTSANVICRLIPSSHISGQITGTILVTIKQGSLLKQIKLPYMGFGT